MKMTAQQRLMMIVEIMSKSGFLGIKNSDLVAAVGVSAAVISRDLTVLREWGWAQRVSNGNNRLTPRFAGFSHEIAQTLREARLAIQREEELYRNEMGGSRYE